MGADDYVNTEAGVVAAATAAAVSPRARELFRRGAVYGLAGALKASDVAVAAARGAVRGAKSGAASTSSSGSGGGTRRRSQPARRRTRSGSAASRSSRSGG